MTQGARVTRSARQVFEDHLRTGLEGTVEEDLARNYADDLVVLTSNGVQRGHDRLRRQADKLRKELPNCTFCYGTQLVEGEFAFLEWSADADGAKVRDGADSYVIRNGQIVAQTIHYTIEATGGDS